VPRPFLCSIKDDDKDVNTMFEGQKCDHNRHRQHVPQQRNTKGKFMRTREEVKGSRGVRLLVDPDMRKKNCVHSS